MCASGGHVFSGLNVQELILFSRADLERSIPSMLDGLKPGQRKILFGCFKRNLSKDIKVILCFCKLYHGADQALTCLMCLPDFTKLHDILPAKLLLLLVLPEQP